MVGYMHKWHHYYLLFVQELRLGKNVMDKIWDRKSFEIGSHWLLWWG